MSTDEQQRSGSVPHAYGNALAWRWSREMPVKLRRSILTLLYALRSMASASGELRFADGKPIRIQDIARAAGADEKDCRRYLRAAIAAGVVAVKGEQKRGKATLYVLVLNPMPDWAAGEQALAGSRRAPGKAPAPWTDDPESSGDRDPNQFGGPRPELTGGTTEEVRGTAPRWSSGDRDPIGSGDRDPNNPGIAKELPHDVVEEDSQPHVDRGPEQQPDPHDNPPTTEADPRQPRQPLGFARCTTCGDRMVPRPGRTTHTHCLPTHHQQAS
ncbi:MULTISPECIES: hypothetical protein [Streptomycetaceae]|uniref:hypothetical protein n=1 Tax=Streptomycetaceae TaxID=2062 RepID=UPI000374DB1F|nr:MULTISPECIES: hypothetical protein [Streptomycetaceae]